jgi:hypothetical protein
MAIFGDRKRKRRRKRRRHHIRRKRRPTPKPKPKPTPKPAPKPAPPPQPPQPPAQPAPPQPAPESSTPASPTSPTAPTDPLAATARERLYLNRFGTGFTQRSLAQLRATGTPEDWLEAQLSPSTVPEAAKVADVDEWFAFLRRTPAEKYATDRARTKAAWEYGHDLGNWTILRRIYSARPVLETMVDFWSAHLHIPVQHDRAWVYRFDYDATIRAHAFGRFEDLLVACSLHPAMRVYLDNWKSVRNRPNENQGRELLELHTVGRAASYTEEMVKSSAVLLSGYTVDWGTGRTFEARYDAAAHTTGAVQVLGFSHPNTSSDGQAATLAYLKYLANHPATARHLARKLATRFVRDDPSDGLVEALASAYLGSGTDIGAVLRTLAGHPEFLTSEGLKVRPPIDDLVATARVLDVDVQAPADQNSYTRHANWTHGGATLFSWPRPDGAPLVNTAWASASRLFASYEMHMNHAGGWWPQGAVYRSAASWLPGSSLRFDAYVDHLCRTWFGRGADARLLLAASQSVKLAPDTVITAKHSLASWLFPRLAMALLDSPDHMTT